VRDIVAWEHAEGVDPPDPPALSGLAQATANGWEDELKMGNKDELRRYFERIPFRLTVERFDLHDTIVEMADLFTGVKMEGEHEKHEDSPHHATKISHVKFKPFHRVTLFAFFEALVPQAIAVLSTKATTTFPAAGKIISQLATNAYKTFKKMVVGGKAVVPKLQIKIAPKTAQAGRKSLLLGRPELGPALTSSLTAATGLVSATSGFLSHQAGSVLGAGGEMVKSLSPTKLVGTIHEQKTAAEPTPPASPVSPEPTESSK